jgi:hypothetical protein
MGRITVALGWPAGVSTGREIPPGAWVARRWLDPVVGRPDVDKLSEG